jgi:hypothetical protein
MGANRAGGERVGNRQVPNTPSAKNKSAFGGAGSGMSGGAARTSGQRGIDLSISQRPKVPFKFDRLVFALLGIVEDLRFIH